MAREFKKEGRDAVEMNTEAARFKFIMNSLGLAALMPEIFLFVCAFLSTLRYHKTFGAQKGKASVSKGISKEVL